MKIELRWQLLLAATCVILVLSLVGTQIQSSPSCTEIFPESGGWLIEGVVGLPQFINPLLSEKNSIDVELVDLIFDGLTRYNSSGELVPALARQWEVSEDGLIYRFELYDELVWHDGEPVTTDDIAFTFELLQDEDFPSSEASKAFWQSVTIEVIDDSHIEFSLPEKYSPFLEATTMGILPAHLFGDLEVSEIKEHAFNRSPIGTGPFMVASGSDWQSDGFLRLAPNPFLWREGTQLDGIEYRFFPDVMTLAAALEKSDIQAVVLPSDSNLGDFSESNDIDFYTSPNLNFTQLLFNLDSQRSTAVQSIEVRRALAHALNRSKLIDEALGGQGLLMEGPYSPFSIAYDPAVMAPIEYDLASAVTNLEAASWVLSEGGEIRQRDDESLEIEILIINEEEFVALANLISDAWREAGIASEVNSVSPSLFAESLKAGDFDVAIVDIEPIGDPDLYDFWSQEAIIDGQNYGSWNNRLASESLERARKLISLEERKAQYRTFLRMFREDLPALTLFQHVASFGVNRNVQGIDIGRVDSVRERYDGFANWEMSSNDEEIICFEETS